MIEIPDRLYRRIRYLAFRNDLTPSECFELVCNGAMGKGWWV